MGTPAIRGKWLTAYQYNRNATPERIVRVNTTDKARFDWNTVTSR